ncbi:hypothetical protein M0R45_019802 [Rubus argutus]|uniref:MHC class I antigen n=1 Tax=Rubus argutus TaxID=59490 RepID=A0AAW1X6W3_RUBAR
MMATTSIGLRGHRRRLEIGRQQWLHTGCGWVFGGEGGSSANDSDAQRRAGDVGVEERLCAAGIDDASWA